MDKSVYPPLSFEQKSEFDVLKQHFLDIESQHMSALFEQDQNRFNAFTLSAAGLNLDYSKNRINQQTITLLCELAESSGLNSAIKDMFAGAVINKSENRPALHTALRNFSDSSVLVDGKDVMPEIKKTLNRMRDFCWAIRTQQWRGFSNNPFTDVVSICIGG